MRWAVLVVFLFLLVLLVIIAIATKNPIAVTILGTILLAMGRPIIGFLFGRSKREASEQREGEVEQMQTIDGSEQERGYHAQH